ncbi:hypothetical protein HRbin29_00118 [bacterium HR29]|jgi:hypothetical protein|nr:hypothetical protein HRbin29_00118 [bacterium HR29]
MQGSSSRPSPTLRVCSHCGAPYRWERSSADLRLTFCSWSCERHSLGTTLEALLGAWSHVPAGWRYLLSA